MSGRHVVNKQRGVERPGQDDGVDVAVRDEVAPGVVVAGRDELQHVARNAAGPELLHQLPGRGHGLGRRLQDDGVAGRERGADAAGRDRVREVPRRHDDDRAEWRRAVEVNGRRRVEASEVDPLAHLGIGLGLGLAGVARHHRGRRRFARPPSRARPAKRIRRRSSIERVGPVLLGASGAPHRLVDLFDRRRRSTDTTVARRRSDRGRPRPRP